MFDEIAFGRIRAKYPDVRTVAVSKGKSVADIRAAISAGVTDIGENYVQEAEEKYLALKDTFKSKNISFHCLGHLQSNKIKAAAKIFDCIHTVDSVKTAKAINSACVKISKMMDVFVEVQFDAAKHGVALSDIPIVVSTVLSLPQLRLRGFMCVATIGDEDRQFSVMQGLLHDYKLRELSMGMSGDYNLAVTYGATMIRLGTVLFGERFK